MPEALGKCGSDGVDALERRNGREFLHLERFTEGLTEEVRQLLDAQPLRRGMKIFRHVRRTEVERE